MRGTATRHIELPATPLCREELQLEQVRIVDHASCLRRNLEGFHMGAMSGGQSNFVRFVLKDIGHQFRADLRSTPNNHS